MSRFIVLLRAVNVGGTGKLPMANLRTALMGAGYENVKTRLASGNVILEAPRMTAARLEIRIERLLTETFGLASAVIARTPEAWADMIAANPMTTEAETHPSAFIAMVMKNGFDSGAARYLQTYDGPERIELGQGCAYISYPETMRDTKLKTDKLGLGTGRNWNTVLKLANMT